MTQLRIHGLQRSGKHANTSVLCMCIYSRMTNHRLYQNIFKSMLMTRSQLRITSHQTYPQTDKKLGAILK